MRANQKTDTSPVKQLSEVDLENVSGGLTKIVDKSSPNLFFGCANGKHIDKGTVT